MAILKTKFLFNENRSSLKENATLNDNTFLFLLKNPKKISFVLCPAKVYEKQTKRGKRGRQDIVAKINDSKSTNNIAYVFSYV